MVRASLIAIVAGAFIVARTISPPSPFGKGRLFNASAGARGAYCSGEYADDLSALSPAARSVEQRSSSPYTRCIRTTAVYECISYGADGNLRRIRRRAMAHGSGFAYRQLNGETLLLTNQHVAEWPVVTDDEHHVDDIPSGCKRISDSLRIVDNEADTYERDDIPLSRVASDTQLDVAVLKAHAALPIMPWRIGKAASLREHNVLDVRGFPLGAFKATTVGKVISAYDHDEEREWDHDDFVTDALLSPGSSGSPVFAVSCRTGELELVGIYHAGYIGGNALNVVIAIDQVRDLMTTLKRTPRLKTAEGPLDTKARARLVETMKQAPEPFFPFGALPAVVHSRADGALIFEVMSKEFPLKPTPIMALEDLPSAQPEEFGALGRIWFGNRTGFKVLTRSELDGDAQAQMNHLLDALRRDSLMAFDYRAGPRKTVSTREQSDQVSREERALRRMAASRADLSATVVELADRLSPHGADLALPISDLLTPSRLSQVTEAIPLSPAAAQAPPP